MTAGREIAPSRLESPSNDEVDEEKRFVKVAERTIGAIQKIITGDLKSICARVSPARWTGYKAYTADNEVKRSSGQWREGRQDVLLSYHSAASPLNLNQRGPTPSLRIRVTGIAAEALLKNAVFFSYNC